MLGLPGFARLNVRVPVARRVCDRLSRSAERMFGGAPQPRVFIFGMQKSGTSAIAGLLASRVGVSVTVDFPLEIYKPSFQEVENERDLQQFIRRNHRELSRCVVKEPNLTYLAHPLLRAFPNAHAIAVIREPAATIRSIFARLGIRGDTQDNEPLRQLATPGWDAVFDGAWQGFGACGPVACMAQRWTRCAGIIDELGSRVHTIRYEDFVSDKQGVVDRAAQAVSLEPKNCIENELDRQFQPRGQYAGSVQDFFGPNLQVIADSTRDMSKRFGYAGLNDV